MLGRGLEALIPPQKRGDDDQSTTQNDAVVSFGDLVQQDVAKGSVDAPMMLHMHDDDLAPEMDSSTESHPFSFSVDFDQGTSSFIEVEEPAAIDIREEQPYAAPVQKHNENQEMISVHEPAVETTPRKHNENQEMMTRSTPHRELQQAVFQVETSKIVPNPHQPRKEFDPIALQELAASIREFGILQPLVVNKIQDGSGIIYQLIAGERRLRASKLLGLPRVPVLIRQAQSNKEQLELAVIENLQREELNPIEMARAYARLQDEFGMTQREVASRLGKSRATVANTLRLLDLPSEIQDAITDGRISESHGRLLLGVQESQLQKSLFQDLLSRNMTTRELRDRLKMTKPQHRKVRNIAASPQQLSPELTAFQERLSSELGAPVNIQSSGERGKITISFYSQEELSAILERLAKENDVLL